MLFNIAPIILFVLAVNCVPNGYRYHSNVGIPWARSLNQSELAARIIGGSVVPSLSQYPYQLFEEEKGFGQTSFPTSTSLYKVDLKVITNTVCQKSFNIAISNGHVCTDGANKVGTCDGDSGGPLAVSWNNKTIL
ncbi:unnamed protein product, partial [Leptidea sinapis]